MSPEHIREFDEFEKAVDKLSAYDEFLTTDLEAKTALVEHNNYQAVLHQSGSEVLKSWLENLLDQNVNSMADLVSNGLGYIIDDQDIRFSIKQEPKYNKISMRFVMSKDGYEGDPMDSYGGGAVLVSSFILRLAIMARLNMANLLIMDEPLNALAVKYIPNCGAFIRQLSEKTGINILMVTHNDEFLNYAHTSYEGSTEVVGVRDGHTVSRLRLDPYEVVRVMVS